MCYGFCDTDGVICEFPDDANVAAAALLINARGAVTVGTTALMTPADLDEAAKKGLTYQPPGS